MFQKRLHTFWIKSEIEQIPFRKTHKEKNTKYKCSNEADHKIILLSLCHGNMVPLLDIIINQRPEPAKPQRQTV